MTKRQGPILRVSVLSRSTWFVMSPGLALFLLAPLLVLVWPRGNGPWPWVLLGPLVGASIVVMSRLSLTHLEIGRDGVLIRRGGAQRFVPFATIAAIEDRGVDLRVALRSGEELVVRTSKDEQVAKDRYATQIDEVVARVKAEIDRRGPREDDATPAQDSQALLAHARSVLQHEAHPPSYRDHAVPPVDELWRVVDDPDADELARAAAAVTLRRRPDAPARLRLRAEETVSPALRKLLRVAADDEPAAALESALDACARRAR